MIWAQPVSPYFYFLKGDKMNGNQYIRTDLASEYPDVENGKDVSGISVSKESKENAEITRVNILTDEGAKLLNKPIGSYITVSFGKVHLLDETELNSLCDTISDIIKNLAEKAVINTKDPKVLIIGLGNRFITPDAIGPLAVKGITVTRHIESKNKELFDAIKMRSISAITPGVSGQTGIDSFELVLGAVETVRPDIVIAIDALASRSVDRLATTIQISDSGISPGSGIGNHTKALNKASLGVPVISVGVPTMVGSSTLVYDALEKAGLEEISPDLQQVLENGKSFYVTVNDCDEVVNKLSKLISSALNQAFSA